MKICSKCKQKKPLHAFGFIKYKNRKRTNCKAGVIYSICRSCNRHAAAVWMEKTVSGNNSEAALNFTLSRLLAFTKANARNKKVSHTLTNDILLALYTEQNGRCFYTNVPMTLKTKLVRDSLSVSIDRKDPTLGYIPENVVLCCLGVNYMKGTNSVEQLQSTLQIIVDSMVEMDNIATTKEEKCHNS